MAEAVNETKEDVQNVKEAVSEDESGNIQNRSFFNKVKDKCFVIYTKIKEIIKLIRDTVKKISGAADRLKEKVSKAKEFVTDEDNRALFHFLVEQLKALIKVIKPKNTELTQESDLKTRQQWERFLLMFRFFMECQVLIFL